MELKNKTNLYLFTLSFPYYIGGENTFLQYELEYLLRYFPKIIIIPSKINGKKQEISREIIIESSFAEYLIENKQNNIQILLKSLFSVLLMLEILNNPYLIFSYKKLKKRISYIKTSLQIKTWAEKYFLGRYKTKENIILYTYWFTQTTLGLGLFKKNKKNIKLITRAHGIDLYEERGQVFCREKMIQLVDFIFLISKNGRDYLKFNYPQFKYKYKIAYLGILSHNNNIRKRKEDNIFRILSCSNVDNNKRIDLIINGIIEISKKNSSQLFEWYHFGNGPLMSDIKKTILEKPDNLTCNLLGFIDNNDLMKFYNEIYFDVFINTSISEGLPVSMMEAQSYGIPVIGTNVGGVGEIINDEVGILINSDPTPIEIANAINWFNENTKQVEIMRKASFKNWDEKFNSDKNFDLFAMELKNLF